MHKVNHRPARIAFAGSGAGRTLANLLRQQPRLRYRIVGVIASRRNIGTCRQADQYSLPLFVGDFRSQKIFSEIYGWLQANEIGWVVLGGFLKPFPVAQDWRDRIVNIHPALLPKYGGLGMYGKNVHSAVIESEDRQSGATVHFVNERYDEGSIIAQITVPRLADDTATSLSDRVFSAECILYPAVIDKLVCKELPRRDGKIEVFSCQTATDPRRI